MESGAVHFKIRSRIRFIALIAVAVATATFSANAQDPSRPFRALGEFSKSQASFSSFLNLSISFGVSDR